MNSNAYWEGYLAAEAGKPRECLNPWSSQWQREWLRGYDERDQQEARAASARANNFGYWSGQTDWRNQ